MRVVVRVGEVEVAVSIDVVLTRDGATDGANGVQRVGSGVRGSEAKEGNKGTNVSARS